MFRIEQQDRYRCRNTRGGERAANRNNCIRTGVMDATGPKPQPELAHLFQPPRTLRDCNRGPQLLHCSRHGQARHRSSVLPILRYESPNCATRRGSRSRSMSSGAQPHPPNPARGARAVLAVECPRGQEPIHLGTTARNHTRAAACMEQKCDVPSPTCRRAPTASGQMRKT